MPKLWPALSKCDQHVDLEILCSLKESSKRTNIIHLHVAVYYIPSVQAQLYVCLNAGHLLIHERKDCTRDRLSEKGGIDYSNRLRLRMLGKRKIG